jgi:hypothetical protein
MLFPQAISSLNVSSDVSLVRTTSRSFIIGTGLKKWRPPNLSFRFVSRAISPIGIELVLEVKIVAGPAT